MTALDHYAKLEALGQYVDGTQSPPTEVVLGFGERTLIITDLSDHPLAHWPLASLRTVGPRDGPGVEIAPDWASAERVRLDDAEMIRAIEAVCPELHSQPAAPPRPPRRFGRWVVLAIVLAAVSGLWWTSRNRDLLAAHVDGERLAALGDAMEVALIDRFSRDAGRRINRCTAPEGRAALGRMLARLQAGGGLAPPRRVVILDLDQADAHLLPGGIVLIHRGVIGRARAPEAVAQVLAHLLAHAMRRDPARQVLRRANLVDGVALAVGGHFDDDLVVRMSEILVEQDAWAQMEDDAARAGAAALSAAGLPVAPVEIAQTLRARHPRLAEPIDGAAITGTFRPVLADRDWIAVQNICERRDPA